MKGQADVVVVELRTQSGAMERYELASDSGASLLEAIEDAGGRSPFGCRVGTCGTCVMRVFEGAQLLVPASRMEEDTLARIPGENPEGLRLACRALFVEGATGVVRVEKVRIR